MEVGGHARQEVRPCCPPPAMLVHPHHTALQPPRPPPSPYRRQLTCDAHSHHAKQQPYPARCMLYLLSTPDVRPVPHVRLFTGRPRRAQRSTLCFARNGPIASEHPLVNAPLSC